MSLYTQTIKDLHRAPYRDQVIVHLLLNGDSIELSEKEEAKIARVQRFLPAEQCAAEIVDARQHPSFVGWDAHNPRTGYPVIE